MGQHAELMAQEWGITRAEQDAASRFESHRKAAEAYRSGYMDDLVMPFSGVFRDNNIRRRDRPRKLATLKTAFDKTERGTLTAANSTPLTDGAAAVLLASEEWAAKHGLPVQAYLTYSQAAANDFVGGEGLLMAPTIAVSQDAGARRAAAAGLRLLRDPRGVRRAGAGHAEGLGRSRYCKDVLGRDEPLGSIDRAKLNVQGLVDRLRASVRGDRRAHRGQPRQASVRARRPRPDLRSAPPAAWASPPSWKAQGRRRCGAAA